MTASIDALIDLDAFPLDRADSAGYRDLVARCQADLARDGMVNLHGLMRAEATVRAVEHIVPAMAAGAYMHRATHNIYFKRTVPGLPGDHPALRTSVTTNRKLCADQLTGNPVIEIYAWPPFAQFLADVMAMPALYPMADPLAAVNVMAYRDGEALGWHFDRSEFTTTLLLQAPDAGGVFEYRQDLRSEDDPNHDGVANLVGGADTQVRQVVLDPGSLNVFRGKNTAHRVTAVAGEHQRIIAVLSYFARPGVVFSDQDRLRFYGRTG